MYSSTPKPIEIVLIFLGIFLITPSVFGQNKKRTKRSNGLRVSFFDASVDSLENAVLGNGFVYAGASAITHVNSLGRDNNVDQWSLNPVVGFHKWNFDVYANGFRWSATDPKWAETDLGISKLWQLSEPLSIITTYEHAFIHYGSDDDKYGINNLFSNQITWANKYFDLNARYEYDFGQTASGLLEFSIGHELDIYDVFTKDKIEITPQFYLTYLSNSANPQPFELANYEIVLPITWRKIGDVECNVSFSLAIPKNVLAEEGNGRPTFYFSGSILKLFTFKSKSRK